MEWFIQQGARQENLIIRRVFKDQAPHHEEICSSFKPHTEWISKGKAGAPGELGLRVGALQDQCGFTLLHHVMVKHTDERTCHSSQSAALSHRPAN